MMSSALMMTNVRRGKAGGSALTSASGFQAGKGRINRFFSSGKTLSFQQPIKHQ
jgi:hypothetical protein